MPACCVTDIYQLILHQEPHVMLVQRHGRYPATLIEHESIPCLLACSLSCALHAKLLRLCDTSNVICFPLRQYVMFMSHDPSMPDLVTCTCMTL